MDSTNAPKITRFETGGHIINNGHVPLITVYFDNDTSINYIASLKFWRATPDEIATIFVNLHKLPTVERTARWIIRKLEMQPEGHSITT